MATGEGSGGEPQSCIQHFSGRKVIRELLFSMLNHCWREREQGEGREKQKCGRQRREGGEEMKGEKELKREKDGAAGKREERKEWEAGVEKTS